MVSRTMAAKQLDRKLLPFKRLMGMRPPKSGWLKAIRKAMHMTQSDVARRLKVRQPTVDDLERSEVSGTISLRTLQRAAQALDCYLIYAIVPKRGLEASVKARARLLSERMARTTDRTMRLEMQGVSAAETRRMINEMSRALSAKPPRRFWAD
jgi:predicted DNA-binding mobile mystery protein A